MKLFDLDSPIMRALSKMADLMLLNLLATICCIPIITAGASFTALHYMCLKLVRNEECYIVRGFFKSFKQNLKQATAIWLLLLVVLAVLVGDFYILNYMVSASFSKVLKVIITVVAIIVVFTATFIFPTLAKFDNPIGRTIKNAFVISVLQLPKTILMFVMNWLPWVLVLFSIRVVPLTFIFGFSAPAFASAFLYNKFFKKLEDQIEESNSNTVQVQEESADERIFHDEVDESISVNENIR